MKISFADYNLPVSGHLAFIVGEDKKLHPLAQKLDEAVNGRIAAAVAATPSFSGKLKEILVLPALLADGGHVFILGAGDKALTENLAETLGGNLQREATNWQATNLQILLEDAHLAAHLAYGVLLRSYRFEKHKTTKKDTKPQLQKLVVHSAKHSEAKKTFQKLHHLADAVFFARDLVSEPANIIYPESFVAEAKAKLEPLGITLEALNEKQMKKLGMGSLLAVGFGSEHESQLLVMEWNGLAGKDNKEPPIALVGKGVTFDTGGISLKPGPGMEEMKWDMAGSAAVTGAMMALAARKAPVHVVGVVGLVENMPDGKAQRPGDIVTSMSGQTIEVLNTDAEGRLVLADCLHYVIDRFKPKAVVDLATLTGAILVALGTEYAGLFANNDPLAEQLLAAGLKEEEKLWRLPLGDVYDRAIDTEAADMKNISADRNAGSIIGAVFLQRFVGKTPWAHLDIAGMAWGKKDLPTVPKGATGYGVRLLTRFVENFS
ncbi:MAG: leucyl aminopeptidase [Alphaproteobacteria bacterium]